MFRDRFFVAGSRPHGPGRPAERRRLASRCATGRRPDRLAGRGPAAVRGRTCVCGRGRPSVWAGCACVWRRGGGPPYLSTFGSKQRAKFPFLGTANRARKVAFAWNREKRCAHLLQNCSTTLPLAQKSPNGGLVGGNKFPCGAKPRTFQRKVRFRCGQTDRGQNAAGGPAPTHENLIPCAGLPAPPVQ